MVVAAETGGALGGMVRQLSIDQFEYEGRRVSYGTPESATASRKLLDRQMSISSVPKKVIYIFFIPEIYSMNVEAFHGIERADCCLLLIVILL